MEWLVLGVDVGCCSAALVVGKRRVSDCKRAKGLRGFGCVARMPRGPNPNCQSAEKSGHCVVPLGQPTDHASPIRCRPLRVKWDKSCGMTGVVTLCFIPQITTQWWAFVLGRYSIPRNFWSLLLSLRLSQT